MPVAAAAAEIRLLDKAAQAAAGLDQQLRGRRLREPPTQAAVAAGLFTLAQAVLVVREVLVW